VGRKLPWLIEKYETILVVHVLRHNSYKTLLLFLSFFFLFGSIVSPFEGMNQDP